MNNMPTRQEHIDMLNGKLARLRQEYNSKGERSKNYLDTITKAVTNRKFHELIVDTKIVEAGAGLSLLLIEMDVIRVEHNKARKLLTEIMETGGYDGL